MSELISDNQAWILDYAIPEAGMTKEQFCRTARIEKIGDLSRFRYKKAMAWLEKKIVEQLDSR